MSGGKMSGDGTRTALAALAAAFAAALCALCVCRAAPPPAPPGAGGGSAAAAAASAPLEQAFVEQGIAVHMTLAPRAPAGGSAGLREGADVSFHFRFTDTASGQPLTGLSPAAWVDALPAGEAAGPAQCKRRIKELLDGSLLTRPGLDLSAYFVLALNDDASLSVIDPNLKFGGSSLLAMVPLLSPGADWALSADQDTLFVSQPEAGRVAVVRTDVWRAAAQVDVGGRPARLALQPDGAFLWVALDGEPAVAVVDTRTLRVAARIAAGAGPHDLAFSDDSAFAFITNRDGGTLTVAGTRSRAALATLATGGSRPVAVAYSPLAHAAYVAHEGDGAIVAVDGARLAVVARLAARPGLGQIRFAPGGRLGFVVNPAANTVQLLDAAANRIVQTGEVGPQPDQIAFTPQLAYIRHRGSDTVLMVPLREVGEPGKPLPVADFSGGQHALGEGGGATLAAGIVPAPDGNAVLVANPLDRAIYYYVEGMAAPQGSFQNYGRQPRAVLVVNRSLSAKAQPGTYETVARLPTPGGRYQVALFLDTPRLLHCFAFDVLPDSTLAARRQRDAATTVEPLQGGEQATAGQSAALRFRLLDPSTGAPRTAVHDLVILVYPLSGAGAQHRALAAELAGGVYEVTFTPPAPGAYAAVVESPSQHLAFHRSPRLLLNVVAPPAAAASSATPRP